MGQLRYLFQYRLFDFFEMGVVSQKLPYFLDRVAIAGRSYGCRQELVGC